MSFVELRSYLMYFLLYIKHFATEFVNFMFEPFTISGVEIYPLEFLLGAFITVTIFSLVFKLFTPAG